MGGARGCNGNHPTRRKSSVSGNSAYAEVSPSESSPKSLAVLLRHTAPDQPTPNFWADGLSEVGSPPYTQLPPPDRVIDEPSKATSSSQYRVFNRTSSASSSSSTADGAVDEPSDEQPSQRLKRKSKANAYGSFDHLQLFSGES